MSIIGVSSPPPSYSTLLPQQFDPSTPGLGRGSVHPHGASVKGGCDKGGARKGPRNAFDAPRDRRRRR